MVISTIIFHCNGSWKYTVISRVNSSGISMFRWDLRSSRMPKNLATNTASAASALAAVQLA